MLAYELLSSPSYFNLIFLNFRARNQSHYLFPVTKNQDTKFICSESNGPQVGLEHQSDIY